MKKENTLRVGFGMQMRAVIVLVKQIAASRLLELKGQKIDMTTNNSDREWMTILVCVNAMGYNIPNLYIFKSKGRKRKDYIERCEPNAKMAFQEKGWINEEIFHQWLDHFRHFVPGGGSLERKYIMLLDEHASHISYNVVNKAAAYEIDNGLLPSHMTHMMQPLDVSIFKSFKCNFINIKERFIHINATWANGSSDKTYLAELASNALKETLTVSNIEVGFKKIGIYPVNVHAMDDECGLSTVFTSKIVVNNNVMETEVISTLFH